MRLSFEFYLAVFSAAVIMVLVGVFMMGIGLGFGIAYLGV